MRAKKAAHRVHPCLVGKTCQFVVDPRIDLLCSNGEAPATHKVEETVFNDDPNPTQNKSHLCCYHFRLVFGGSCK